MEWSIKDSHSINRTIFHFSHIFFALPNRYCVVMSSELDFLESDDLISWLLTHPDGSIQVNDSDQYYQQSISDNESGGSSSDSDNDDPKYLSNSSSTNITDNNYFFNNINSGNHSHYPNNNLPPDDYTRTANNKKRPLARSNSSASLMSNASTVGNRSSTSIAGMESAAFNASNKRKKLLKIEDIEEKIKIMAKG